MTFRSDIAFTIIDDDGNEHHIVDDITGSEWYKAMDHEVYEVYRRQPYTVYRIYGRVSTERGEYVPGVHLIYVGLTPTKRLKKCLGRLKRLV
jgi:hypothetical protein